MVYDLIVIGGGAAGMMAAAQAAESSPNIKIVVIERNNKLGRKVAISGGGRCNVTTGIEDPKEILKRYPRGAKFLSYGMYEFGPSKVREWFNEHGLPTKVEEDLRVFPVSDHGEDVIEVYKKIFAQNNVEIMYGEIVKSVQKNNEEFVVELNTGKKISSKNIVLASGGQAYRHTGSQGDSYSFAQALGHSITQLGPSLNSFLLRQPWVKSLAGVSFEKATLTSPLNKKYIFSGAFVFTHRGISGPAVFAMSSLTAFEKYSPQTPMPLTIDFFPDSNNEQLLKKITELITTHPRKNFANIIDMLLPKSMVEVVITQSHADGQRDSAQVSKQTLQAVVQFLKHCTVDVIGYSAGEEFVTAGGVETSEVDNKTMASKLCPGLYFAGEILNIDGFTGGFNLQAAWATGALAGRSIAEKIASS